LSAPPESGASRTLSDRLGFAPAVVELGPTHAGVRRVMGGVGATTSFLVTLDDDRIEALEVEIGLGHRGFEHEVESRPWLEALPYVARLGYAGSPIAQTAYCLALEPLMGLEPPERATWLRTLVCELARVGDHLARIAALAAALGTGAAERAARRAEQVALGVLASALGAPLLEPWAVPGGVARDLPDGFSEAFRTARDALRSDLDRIARDLLEQPSAVARLVDVAALDGASARALGVTGPCLRAAGVARDLRRDAPYLAYGELDFALPVGTRGDDFDRLAVVIAEIRESLRMAGQCLARLPDAPPAFGSGSDAADRTVGPGEVAFSVEGSTGELGFLLVSDGGRLPRRLRVRAPSFFHAQALPAALIHARLDDLLPTAALFHLVSAECDR